MTLLEHKNKGTGGTIEQKHDEISTWKFERMPRHVGFIPDGNRRWAVKRGLEKHQGYIAGVDPAFQIYDLCVRLGIEEISVYGFTQDNTKRPAVQRVAYQQACVAAVGALSTKDASLRVIGESDSPLFPPELIPYTERTIFGKGTLKINLLVNYSWQWDLAKGAMNNKKVSSFLGSIGSSDVTRIDLIVRWGGHNRLSGFLPVQSVYSDIFVVDALWPDFRPQHIKDALDWYQSQDVTLGG